MRILIADDNREVRSALRLALFEVAAQAPETAAEELRIYEAANMAELLVRLLEHRDLGLILLDWELPGSDPSQTVTAIKTRHPRCVVVAMTGHAEAEGQARALGVDRFVCKNDSPTRLLGLLRDLMLQPRLTSA